MSYLTLLNASTLVQGFASGTFLTAEEGLPIAGILEAELEARQLEESDLYQMVGAFKTLLAFGRTEQAKTLGLAIGDEIKRNMSAGSQVSDRPDFPPAPLPQHRRENLHELYAGSFVSFSGRKKKLKGGIRLSAGESATATPAGVQTRVDQISHEPGVEVKPLNTMSEGVCYLWQRVRFGGEREQKSRDSYRGYLMIDSTDVLKALDLLLSIARERLKEGKQTDFKWITECLLVKRILEGKASRGVGDYQYVKPTACMVCLYANTLEDILEILTALAKNPAWEEMEANRRKQFHGAAPRRPGTNALAIDGREYRSLNYNDEPGHSDDEGDWRNEKVGRSTASLRKEKKRVKKS